MISIRPLHSSPPNPQGTHTLTGSRPVRVLQGTHTLTGSRPIRVFQGTHTLTGSRPIRVFQGTHTLTGSRPIRVFQGTHTLTGCPLGQYPDFRGLAMPLGIRLDRVRASPVYSLPQSTPATVQVRAPPAIRIRNIYTKNKPSLRALRAKTQCAGGHFAPVDRSRRAFRTSHCLSSYMWEGLAHRSTTFAICCLYTYGRAFRTGRPHSLVSSSAPSPLRFVTQFLALLLLVLLLLLLMLLSLLLILLLKPLLQPPYWPQLVLFVVWHSVYSSTIPQSEENIKYAIL